MKITIIYGGKSGEHEVSLVSASSIVRNIDKTKYEVSLIGIAKNGYWYLQENSETTRVLSNQNATLQIHENTQNIVNITPGGGQKFAFKTATKNIETDVVILVLHGTYGEDGTIQGLFDMAEIPYTGCGCCSSAISMDKEKTKIVWKEAGLPVLPHLCLKQKNWGTEQERNKTLQTVITMFEKEFQYPLFVKPCCAGSSVGAAKAKNRAELENAITEAFRWDEKLLIEPAIEAREIECSLTGNSTISLNSADEIKSYGPGEIKPTHDFYDYDAKYTDPDGASLCIPAELDSETTKYILQTAKKAYEALDCTGLSRVDFFIDKKTNKLYLNEINTMPGFTSISMFPKMCESDGLKYSKLLELLVTQATTRFQNRQNLQTSRL